MKKWIKYINKLVILKIKFSYKLKSADERDYLIKDILLFSINCKVKLLIALDFDTNLLSIPAKT